MKEGNILVYGLGVSGISAVKALNIAGKKPTVYDKKNLKELESILDEIKGYDFKLLCKNQYPDMNDFQVMIKSPGIPPDDEIIKNALQHGVNVISDVEAAYLLNEKRFFIGISGTNGKTTTTTIIGEMFKKAEKKHIVTGNIGSGIMYDMAVSCKDTAVIAELSSFQLEHTYLFKPDIYVLTNITEDHTDWHGSFEKYAYAKTKIIDRMSGGGICIMNYDDPALRGKSYTTNTDIRFFSSDNVLEEGIFLENDVIKIRKKERIINLINKNNIFIKGKHNIENAMAAAYVAYICNIDINVIENVLKEFRGVEHRLEFAGEINKIKYYNDSKATNTESSIKAINSFSEPIILIAGGYDKNADFTDFTKLFNGKVKKVFLIGETAQKIKQSCIKNKFSNYEIVICLEEALIKAEKAGSEGDVILLSPACASWDMYKNYEERGNEFKSMVKILEKRHEKG